MIKDDLHHQTIGKGKYTAIIISPYRAIGRIRPFGLCSRSLV